MSRPPYEYTAYGLHVRSPFALPFTPLPGGPHGGRGSDGERGSRDEPDVRVRIGTVPAALPASADRRGLWESAPGAFLLDVPGVARYLATHGRDVLVEPTGGGNDVGVFLIGPVFAAVLQQRGVMTFHAAAVETGAGAVLFMGRSGDGKSSLLAELVERGHPMLADDVAGVVLDADGRPVALPAFPCLRLWADVLDKLAWPGRARSRVRPGLDKYLVPVDDRFRSAPLPVRAVCRLSSHAGDGVEVETAPAAGAFSWLLRSVYRRNFLRGLGQHPTCFRAVTALAKRVPTLFVARHSWPLRLDALADRIEEYLREKGPEEPPAAGRGAFPAGRASPAERQGPLPCGKARKTNAAPPAPTSPTATPPSPAPPPLRRPVGDAAGSAARSRGSAPAASIVWLVSYPKSGNTWLRAVLTNYLRDDGERGSHSEPASINALLGPPVASSRETFDELVGLDSSDLTPEEVLRHRPLLHELLARESTMPAGAPAHEGAPVFVKVHEAYLRTVDGTALFPKAATAGVVYLVRSPLDVAVSYAHHRQRSIDDTVRWMNDPEAAEARVDGGIFHSVPQPLATWSGHASSWLDQEALPMHVARYEDLLADPAAAFGAIVRFAGLDRAGTLPDDGSARLARAVHHAGFSRLRAQEEESGFCEKQPTAPSFFRAGVSGSWREALDPRQVQALVDAHGPVMARLGYLSEAEAFLNTPASR